MMSLPDPHTSDRGHATRAADDGWRRGFAEPDLEDEDPPVTSGPPILSRTDSEVGKVGVGVFKGIDDRGVITVTVDRSGQVAEVVVAPTWRDTVGAPELGSALLTAANNALTSHLADKIEQMGLDADDAWQTGGTPSSHVPQRLNMREVADLLAVFDRDLQAYRDQLDAAVNVTGTATGPNGRVRVTMTPGRVAEVTADPRWASYARYTEIRFEARTAFQTATQRLGNTDPSAVPVPKSIARLRELAGELARGTGS
jgi:hypothetical protein